MSSRNNRQHEVAFCAEISKFSDNYFKENTGLPLGSSDIETFSKGSNKRQDLRFYDREKSLILCGEVKLPGTIQGQSPFNPILMNDAFMKATAENCRYFFTWNVEELALFDRSLWDAATMHERCVGHWKLGEYLDNPTDVTRPDVIKKLREKFLPEFFTNFAEVFEEKVKDFALPPADFYLAVLETYLRGPRAPVRELRDFLALESVENSAFRKKFFKWMTDEQEWNFNPDDPKSWREIIDRAARSMCYVLSNRILFYQAVSLRNDLPKLDFPKKALNNPQTAIEHLSESFREAIHITGDYESIFFPEKGRDEWSALTALSGKNSIEAWNNFIEAIEKLNFKEIPTDILGKTFQKLISPEERHRFGQHYTEETIVDLINAFCIRKGNAKVFDPSCGSGSFLVRAYYRKHQIDKSLSHQELLEDIYGCDINSYPAHLATLNLAARQITNEENYPRIAHTNFFKVTDKKTFCELPKMDSSHDGRRGVEKIHIPELDAIIGNPPYVRQEKIPKKKDKKVVVDQTKEYIGKITEQAYPGSNISKQSDLHVYFWLASARFLAKDGWFGFLTSSSWLDARYGFALQRWILQHFRLVAIIESLDEPWFSDARVKTCATILQVCDDAANRDENLVRFVRLKRPLFEILHKADWENIQEHDGQEHLRQNAAESLRDRILSKKKDHFEDELRILVKRQGDLWGEGLSVAEMFERQKELSRQSAEDIDQEESKARIINSNNNPNNSMLDYGGGKWGRYLRAPDFYFQIMRDYGNKFFRLGDIAQVKFGIKSGCDAFFMPRDVTKKLLNKHRTESEWKLLPLMKRCNRKEVESGKVRIIEAGDKTIHPIESKYVRPEIHSPMQLSRPIVTENQTDRVVLWVNQPIHKLKSSYAYEYIIWGSKQTFASNKSKSVPVPKRETCANREPWYDLTGLKPGIGFWTKAQKYRHIVPYNPHELSCNCNLYDIHSIALNTYEDKALMAILNSTLISFFKHFYGRYVGTEGTLKTEIVDVLMMEIPSPIGVSKELSEKLKHVLEKISEREVTHLLEEEFRLCTNVAEMRILEKNPVGLPLELQREDRRELDLLVFELMGVNSAEKREKLVDELYYETTRYYRAQRIQDIQASANRTQNKSKGRVSANSIAMAAWVDLDSDLKIPLSEWLEIETPDAKKLELPEGDVRLPNVSNMFEATTLYFGSKNATDLICENRVEAELLEKIAVAGLRGEVLIPKTEQEAKELSSRLEERLNKADKTFIDIAQNFAADEKLQHQIRNILHGWFILGK